MDINRTRFTSILEFWPYYIQEHSRSSTRWLHFIGNTNLFAWLLLALLRRSPRLVITAVASSYAIAWVGHFFFERNIPATFRYPLMSAVCDMWMYRQMWRGEMRSEISERVLEDPPPFPFLPPI